MFFFLKFLFLFQTLYKPVYATKLIIMFYIISVCFKVKSFVIYPLIPSSFASFFIF